MVIYLRIPSEWSVTFGLCQGNFGKVRWSCPGSAESLEGDVGAAGGAVVEQTFESFAFRFYRVSLLIFSAAHTDLEYSEDHARDWGLTVFLHMSGHGGTVFEQQ